MIEVKAWSYCPGVSANYGVNAMAIRIEAVTFYFSYSTCVAFRAPGPGLVVCENRWGPTTGKHLNAIDNGDKAHRLPHAEFDAKLAEVLDTYGLHEPTVQV